MVKKTAQKLRRKKSQKKRNSTIRKPSNRKSGGRGRVTYMHRKLSKKEKKNRKKYIDARDISSSFKIKSRIEEIDSPLY